ncbi:21 kDa subunit of NADH dehydrogenase [Rhizodiscina lignyota]|uniref:21 kDa subunit of NADH dehydrogenase n=1 Tax=Rhizodiscina lignyota TaxID=1504668 RepID=A0A9P4IJX5_9PEZI|nr:21 kDa subunit of NADH dehydrogenase [Rhizodiscina lignyota]
MLWRGGLAKYTVQPTGIWATINKWLAIDSGRSTGIPLNPQFRNPPPGANDPNAYDDPVTVPAADLAENPYWKRDVRRRYSQLSTVKQGDVVALLTVGSKASPKEDVLQIGDAGAKQLVAVKEEGEKGLATFFKKEKGLASGVLGPDGMPPMPVAFGGAGPSKKYDMLEDQSYGGNYPCRTFQ